MELATFLKLLAHKNGSDLFFSAGARPHMKIQGTALPMGKSPVTGAEILEMAHSVMDENQKQEFEQTWECNLATGVRGVGRFRVNLFRQRGQTAMVIRYINDRIPTIEELRLPPILKDLVQKKRGLVLVVGATGSGKSTSLASMIGYRNENLPGHILTIEDPIEFMHQHKRSIVNQREVGLDTQSYGAALKNAMREAPDVILIGEIRDMATMQHALAYAETGHLCLSTLHANNANQALDRIINFFPEAAHQQIRMDLSLNLQAVISQRLIPGKQGGMVAAVEVMLLSRYISELILKGEVKGLKDAMEETGMAGMQTFDQALYKLYNDGQISLEQALTNADSHNDLSLRIRMNAGVQGGTVQEDLLDPAIAAFMKKTPEMTT